MDCLEKLGTEYCPNCAILKNKLIELQIREKIIQQRENELDQEILFLKKLKTIERYPI
jgi:hypothetical protein